MPPTRRALLSAAAAATAALAGCNRTTTSPRGTTPTETAGDAPTNPDADGAIEFGYLRGDDDRALAWREREDRSTDDVRRHPGTFVVDGDDRASTLRYADVPGADEVEAFVADTDFETETVLVDQSPVEDCYRLDLCGVSWSTTELDFEYGWVALPWDHPCQRERKVTEARFVRIPEPLEDADVRGRGASYRPEPCRGGPSKVAGADRPGTDPDRTTTTAADEPSTTAGGVRARTTRVDR